MKRRRSQTNLGYKGHTIRKKQRKMQRSKYVPRGRSMYPEKKGLDSAYFVGVDNTFNDNSNIFPVNLIRAGTGSMNRIGRKVTNKSLRITGTINHRTVDGAIVAGDVYRISIVYDSQPSASATVPSYDIIFKSTDQTGAELTDFNSTPAYDSMSRFKVLREITRVINPAVNENQGGHHYEYIDEYIKLNLPDTVYSGDSSPMTISDINSGAIYLIVRRLTDQGTATFSCTTRLRYTDG